ncbi:sigma-70 family RNA polymerase sigma factor [Fulvivirgaceae bacterium BMA10]|uniref:Sigma-70 family RNA polymerase sigma factor n=1 Tax=Splendidivirga corallicola TaxID=3051826 RepID=A0ABT8KKD3_9BACT|nr:sigma-70 family RNA polymerase sigma factor [Fulvivirgaceae bacterium BMA10]
MSTAVNQGKEPKNTSQMVEHLFRHESGKVISHLTRKFGTQHIEIIEDAVQEALIKAMQLWPYHGAPQNPTAWILRVANNKLIDVLRRKKKMLTSEDGIFEEEHNKLEPTEEMEVDEMNAILKDDMLKMIFACCHPVLKAENQIILTLKILCGFGKAEIARALLKKEDAVAKAYTRAKAKLKNANVSLEVPEGEDLKNRLSVVLKIIYLLFNEGYTTSTDETLIRRDMCFEAIRLNKLLAENNFFHSAEAHALMALMHFHASRFDARLDANGKLLTLDQQDRKLWDTNLINLAIYHMSKSGEGQQISEYHIQAGIAASHCLSEDYQSTDWKQILSFYDILIKIKPAPIAALNRIVAFSKVHGAELALKELQKIEEGKHLDEYYLLHAIQGDLLIEMGKKNEARECIKKAMELTKNTTEKNHLKDKLEAIG